MPTGPDAWRWWVRGIAAIVILIGVVLLFTPISARFYQEYYPPGSYSTSYRSAPAKCITAWADWTGNYAHNPVPVNAVQSTDDTAGSDACDAVISGRQHLSLTLIILGVIGVGVSFLRRREYILNAPPPTTAPVPGPAPASQSHSASAPTKSGSVTYELEDWSQARRIEIDRDLENEGIPHTWQASDLIVERSDEATVDRLVYGAR